MRVSEQIVQWMQVDGYMRVLEKMLHVLRSPHNNAEPSIYLGLSQKKDYSSMETA